MTEYPSDPQPKLDVAVIRESLAGYALANEVIEAERQATLARICREEALATWRHFQDKLADLAPNVGCEDSAETR